MRFQCVGKTKGKRAGKPILQHFSNAEFRAVWLVCDGQSNLFWGFIHSYLRLIDNPFLLSGKNSPPKPLPQNKTVVWLYSRNSWDYPHPSVVLIMIWFFNFTIVHFGCLCKVVGEACLLPGCLLLGTFKQTDCLIWILDLITCLSKSRLKLSYD